MTVERILLAQLADIGDLVLATPAMAALREAKPRATIDLLAFAPAVDIVPSELVDAIIPLRRSNRNASRALLSPGNLRALFSLRARGYNTVIFFHHFTLPAGLFKFRIIAAASAAKCLVGLKNRHADFLTDWLEDEGFGARHEAQYWLDVVALVGASADKRPAQVKREASSLVSSVVSEAGKAPIVVMHAGSGGYSKARRWAPAGFADVARQLKARYGALIVLVGGAGDDSMQVAHQLGHEAVNLVGKTSLPQLADMIWRADLFIGADSGVMHIAAATGSPLVSIFGPSNHHAWGPWPGDKKSALIRSGVACSPCSYVGRSIGARDGCRARTCMKLVSPRQVLEAAADILEGRQIEQSERSVLAAPHPQRLRILGLPVDNIGYGDWMRRIQDWMAANDGPRQVCTVNPEFIMIAREDPIFFNILNRAHLCLPDGVGLLWASRRLGSPIAERVTGSDSVPMIARHAAREGWRIFFLGAGSGVANTAAANLCRRYPDLQVAGAYAGSPAESEEDDIVAMINGAAVDILFVAYGAPQQDKWIARNLPRLQVKMAMGVGGSLDFAAGIMPRAPEWMRRQGLEWCYRLLRQPWRWRRMLRLPRFVAAVLRHR